MNDQVARHAVATYCDDIRQEAGNKLSIMGIYQRELIVSDMPTRLPKLCVYVVARTSADDPFSSLVIEVTRQEDEVLGQMQIKDIETPKIEEGVDVDRLMMAFAGVIQFSPFEISTEDTLRVLVRTERETLRAGALKIRKKSTAAAA